MVADDVLYLPVRELAARIKDGKVSPVELTEAYLKRSEKIGGKLNAFATLTPERARKEAKEAEKEIKDGKYRGSLHGVPYAVKDLLAAKGYPTTWGAKPYAKQTFDEDATVVRRLRDAGAVLIGKSAMIELAGGFGYRYASASLSGPCQTPWSEKHWAGGSSSGSGAIAAAGLAAFAIGTETWGSILCPAAYCGATGLRPTYGRVSRRGGMALSFSMDKIGVLARTADDCALVLEAMAGPDPLDPTSHPDGTFKDAAWGDKKLRVGWLVKMWDKIDSKIEAVIKKAVEAFAGKDIAMDDAELPKGPWEPAAGTVLSAESATAFDALLESGKVSQLADPLQQVAGYATPYIPAADYVRAQRIRVVLQRKIDELFEKHDVLMAATLPIPATPLDAKIDAAEYDFPDPLGAIGNFCGLPAISVPCGFTGDKLPLGIQFVGRALDDHKVLAAARLFQKRTEWHLKRPPV
jgi:aspartyl-tRNA(Asn)/glutamyl-tRNA(Gln) amidotransferase subunit A